MDQRAVAWPHVKDSSLGSRSGGQRSVRTSSRSCIKRLMMDPQLYLGFGLPPALLLIISPAMAPCLQTEPGHASFISSLSLLSKPPLTGSTVGRYALLERRAFHGTGGQQQLLFCCKLLPPCVLSRVGPNRDQAKPGLLGGCGGWNKYLNPVVLAQALAIDRPDICAHIQRRDCCELIGSVCARQGFGWKATQGSVGVFSYFICRY